MFLLRVKTWVEALNKQLSPFWFKATDCSPSVIDLPSQMHACSFNVREANWEGIDESFQIHLHKQQDNIILSMDNPYSVIWSKCWEDCYLNRLLHIYMLLHWAESCEWHNIKPPSCYNSEDRLGNLASSTKKCSLWYPLVVLHKLLSQTDLKEQRTGDVITAASRRENCKIKIKMSNGVRTMFFSYEALFLWRHPLKQGIIYTW